MSCAHPAECLVVFFSSRRRHTRWNCDWSSDVCSSDLDRGLEHAAQLAVGGLLLDVGGGTEGGHVVPLGALVPERLEPALPARTGQRLVHGNAGEPGSERRPPGELMQVREGTHVGLLHDVLGLAVVAQDGARRAVEALVVTAHDDLEERRLAAAHARHDLLIGEPADPRWYDLHSLIHRGPYPIESAARERYPATKRPLRGAVRQEVTQREDREKPRLRADRAQVWA